MILVIFAMVLMNPTLHTQSPATIGPPANGGTGSGSSGAAGAGNGTTPTCSVTSGGQESDGHNETDVSTAAIHPLDDGNDTNGTGTHDGSACGDPPVDHDSVGDVASHEHRGAASEHRMQPQLEADAIALAQVGVAWGSSVARDFASLGASLTGLFAGLVPSGFL